MKIINEEQLDKALNSLDEIKNQLFNLDFKEIQKRSELYLSYKELYHTVYQQIDNIQYSSPVPKSRFHAIIEETKILDVQTTLLYQASKMSYNIKENNTINIYNVFSIATFQKPQGILTLSISKDKKAIVTERGLISLSQTFNVGPLRKIEIDRCERGKEIIDYTDYTEILLISGNATEVLCTFDIFDNEFFLKYYENLNPYYALVCSAFSKIFNDLAGNYDYPEVREVEDDTII